MRTFVLAQASLTELPAQLGAIFYYVVLPILILAGLGFAIQRFSGMDMKTLTLLNFYVTMPAMIYFSVVTSTERIAAEDVGVVVLFALAMLAALWAVTMVAAYATRTPREVRNVVLMSTLFHNSGNYGLPLQDMAFRGAGLSAEASTLQIFYMLVQNAANFTLGIVFAATGGASRPRGEALRAALRFPALYALAAALLTVLARYLLGGSAPRVAGALSPAWEAIIYLKGGFIALALVTLGAKLATVGREASRYSVTLSVVIRLVAAPVLGVAVAWGLGLTGFIAQVVIISTSTPTAVNCMLLCLQFDNHPDFAARAVFYSSIISPITVTLTIFLAQGGFLPFLQA